MAEVFPIDRRIGDLLLNLVPQTGRTEKVAFGRARGMNQAAGVMGKIQLLQHYRNPRVT
jgi:hypothetical protein